MATNLLGDNRRKAYRVRPIATDDLHLALVLAGERFSATQITDVANGGASVRFRRGDAPAVETDEDVAIRIDSPNLPGGAVVPARVVYAGSSDRDHIVNVAFDDDPTQGKRASEAFLELFNRRVTYRDVFSQLGVTLSATITALHPASADASYPVNVQNISTTGVCLRADQASDRFMRIEDEVRLHLELPNLDKTRSIVTHLCYRNELNGASYYGCRFDLGATAHAAQVQAAIADYTSALFEDELEAIKL